MGQGAYGFGSGGITGSMEYRNTRARHGHKPDRPKGPRRGISRRLLQRSFVNVDDESAKLGVVLQSLPRQWVVPFSNPEKSAERHHGVLNFPGNLVDHEV